ncbi:hypothetical protein ABZ934_30000 [Streptomyces sp. NPDC046557]|uniref:hypothetical protein n=1 Tax=Streptomyces sp. NPDC046557 TaxID=3155372 RepID=UPI0033C878AC
MRIAGLVRDAGTLRGLEAARDLLAEIREAGITAAEAVLELALAFHHAVLGEHDKVRAVIDRLRELARAGDYGYYADIAHYMGGLPLSRPVLRALARWGRSRAQPLASPRPGPPGPPSRRRVIRSQRPGVRSRTRTGSPIHRSGAAVAMIAPLGRSGVG